MSPAAWLRALQRKSAIVLINVGKHIVPYL